MSEELVVLECDYVYNGWTINCKTKDVVSKTKVFQQRKATDDYRLCGVYKQANIPYKIIKVTDSVYPSEEAYKAIPRAFSDYTYEAIKNGNRVLTPSGYCVYAPAIVGGIQRAIGEDKKIGIVWIDAHYDNVIVEKTNRDKVTLVGVPLSSIMGQTMEEWRIQSCGLKKTVSDEFILAGDGRCSDEECINNIRQTSAILINEDEFENSSLWKNRVEELSNKVDAIYLMVDADILKAEFVPAYYREEKGGHDVGTVMKNIEYVMQTNKVLAFSSFCIDFDKYKQGGDTTYLNGMRIIASGLLSWKKRPYF